jgi:hypothetical protein
VRLLVRPRKRVVSSALNDIFSDSFFLLLMPPLHSMIPVIIVYAHSSTSDPHRRHVLSFPLSFACIVLGLHFIPSLNVYLRGVVYESNDLPAPIFLS